MATKKSLESKKREMASAYLKYGTFRKAEAKTGYSKSSIHIAVQQYIEKGGFEEVDELEKLVKQNLSERHIRGGQATKRRFEILKCAFGDTYKV